MNEGWTVLPDEFVPPGEGDKGGLAANFAPGGNIRYYWERKIFDLDADDLTQSKAFDIYTINGILLVDLHFFPSCYM